MSPKVEGLRTEETSLRYPKELVERYGAKAGLLLYVAQKLPDIPQAPMIVNEPGEDIEDFLRRADKAGIDYPRFFRSSAVAELLGYEGMFGTEVVRAFETGHQEVRHNANYYGLYRDREYYDRGVREIIDQVKHSPQNLKRSGVGFELPNEINVIIAEKSPSLFVGTLIKHPNQDNRYLITIPSDPSRNLYGERGEPTDARRTCYSYSPTTGPEVL